jgi:hypothetical protein
MAPEPHLIAWFDQFGALLRDQCRQIQEVVYLTGWDRLAIEFTDAYDDDDWRLSYRAGHFWVTNLTEDKEHHVELDLDALGVNRR